MKKFFLLQFMLLYNLTFGTSYYVNNMDITANDSNSGSIDSPWLTINNAIEKVQPGDTIIVNSGNYERATISKSGTSSQPITIRAEKFPNISYNSSDQNRAQLLNSNEVTTVKGFYLSTGIQHIIIDGFEITDIGKSNSYQGFRLFDNVSNVTISNNYLHNLEPALGASGGIRMSNSTSNCLITNNVFCEVEGIAIEIHGQNHIIEKNDISHAICFRISDDVVVNNDCDNIRFWGFNHIIRNNYLHDTYEEASNLRGASPHSDGFQTFYVAGQLTDNIVIEKNILNTQGRQALMMTDTDPSGNRANNVSNVFFRQNIVINPGTGTFAVDIKDLTIENNIFVDCRYQLILYSDIENFKAYNNIYYQDPNGTHPTNGFGSDDVFAGPIFYDNAELTNFDIDHNLFWPDISSVGDKQYLGTNNIYDKEIIFVDVTDRNYRPVAGSPIIDTGFQRVDFTTDYDGDSRPIDQWDIGPFEYGSSGEVQSEEIIKLNNLKISE